MLVRHVAGTNLLVDGVPDLRDRNRKARNIVLIRDLEYDDTNEEAAEAVFLYGVAITSKFSTPVEPPLVTLSFHKDKKARTGLTTPSAAHCGWGLGPPALQLIERTGYVGDAALRDIMRILHERFQKK